MSKYRTCGVSKYRMGSISNNNRSEVLLYLGSTVNVEKRLLNCSQNMFQSCSIDKQT